MDLAIEAVTENTDIKKEVFRNLDRFLPSHALAVSNTSALSLEQLARTTNRPDRTAGLHFFNPVQKMALVEIGCQPQTSRTTIAALVDVVRALGKVPLVVADQPGFLVNRVLFSYLDEAVRLIWEGALPEQVDRAAKDFGMPMGPLEVLDQVGLDVAAEVAKALSSQASEPSPAPEYLEHMVAHGRLGKKSGHGFYRYHRGRRTTAWLIPKTKKPVNTDYLADSSPETFQKRLVCTLVNEAARCLEHHVVAEAWMVDLGMVLGMGFPSFRGGPLRLADDMGLPSLMSDLEALQHNWGPRFSPCQLLRNMIDNGQRFYPEEKPEPARKSLEQLAGRGIL